METTQINKKGDKKFSQPIAGQCSTHIDTSRLICTAVQVTGLYRGEKFVLQCLIHFLLCSTSTDSLGRNRYMKTFITE